jgi:hypothetical protein
MAPKKRLPTFEVAIDEGDGTLKYTTIVLNKLTDCTVEDFVGKIIKKQKINIAPMHVKLFDARGYDLYSTGSDEDGVNLVVAADIAEKTAKTALVSTSQIKDYFPKAPVEEKRGERGESSKVHLLAKIGRGHSRVGFFNAFPKVAPSSAGKPYIAGRQQRDPATNIYYNRPRSKSSTGQWMPLTLLELISMNSSRTVKRSHR